MAQHGRSKAALRSAFERRLAQTLGKSPVRPQRKNRHAHQTIFYLVQTETIGRNGCVKCPLQTVLQT